MSDNQRCLRSQRGQVVPLFAIVLTLLVGFASLALDSTNNQGSQLRAQLASDSAVLGAASTWSGEPASGTGALALSPTDAVFVQAQKLAGVNGVDTTPGGATNYCNSSGSTQAHIIFYDKPVVTCAVPAGWTRKVEVTVPPLPTVPAACTVAYQCVQVQTTILASNALFATIGLSRTTVSAASIAKAAGAAVVAATPTATFVVGDNAAGEHGDGGVANQNTPKSVLLPNVMSASSGTATNFVLQPDGTVQGWGINTSNELGNGNATSTLVPGPAGSGLTNITDIVTGNKTTLARRADGTLWAWGSNAEGEFGNGGTTASTTPVQVLKGACPAAACPTAYLSNVVTIGDSQQTSFAVTGDGILYAWGDNTHGELGINSTVGPATSPVQVMGAGGAGLLGKVVSITGGQFGALALTSLGTVYDWGINTWGQLAVTATADITTPHQVLMGGTNGFPGVDLPRSIASNLETNHAIMGNSLSVAWGRDEKSELGNATTNATGNPAPVSVLLGGSAIYRARQVAAGASATYVLKDDGAVYTWGSTNSLGQMGDASNTARTSAVQVSGFASNASAVFAGGDHAMITMQGPAEAWGNNSNGQLGQASCCGNLSSPVAVKQMPTIHAMSAGATQTQIVAGNGVVLGWGSNSHGELGNGTVVQPTTTVATAGSLAPQMLDVAGGLNWGFGYFFNSTTYSWGLDSYGQLGQGHTPCGTPPCTTNYSTPTLTTMNGHVQGIAAGQDFMFFIRDDGTLNSAGRNNAGQLGNGTTTNGWSVGNVSTLSGMVGIAGGTAHGVALGQDGSVWTWGSNSNGQLGPGAPVCPCKVPTKVTGFGAGSSIFAAGIRAGGNTTEVLASDGTVWSWGANANGQLGNNAQTAGAAGDAAVHALDSTLGAPIANVRMISAGSGFDMAVTGDGNLWGWGTNANGELGVGTVVSPQLTAQKAGLAGVGVTRISTSDHVLILGGSIATGGGGGGSTATLVG